jgi:hypothetical protein
LHLYKDINKYKAEEETKKKERRKITNIQDVNFVTVYNICVQCNQQSLLVPFTDSTSITHV